MTESDSITQRARYLIVNADDFGRSAGVTQGIIEAHEKGIVTSASLMVRYPGTAEAAVAARAHPSLSVGLHFDAAEWQYRSGNWVPCYEVIDTSDAAEVEREFKEQLATFERLLDRRPTHLDSHQHVHNSEPARSVLGRFARQLRVPLRNADPIIRHCGDFYGQTREGEAFPEGISVRSLIRLLENLPPGWTEMGCHPGRGVDFASVYAAEREEELRVLCSSPVREAINRQGIALRSFGDYPFPDAARPPLS